MNNVEIKIGQSAISGRVQGVYNKETGKGEVKRGISSNGNKFQVFEISVASKEKDSDKWTNGKNIPIMMFGEVPVEVGQNVGLLGRFVPNNWTNQEGKEVRGMQFMCNAEDMFEANEWTKKEAVAKEEPAQEDSPW